MAVNHHQVQILPFQDILRWVLEFYPLFGKRVVQDMESTDRINLAINMDVDGLSL